MIPEIVLQKINKGAALLKGFSEHYPRSYNGKIPLKVRMVDTVTSDLPIFLAIEADEYPILIKNNEYYVSVNSHGAVTGITPDGRELGLKPFEFEVIEFHPQKIK